MKAEISGERNYIYSGQMAEAQGFYHEKNR